MSAPTHLDGYRAAEQIIRGLLKASMPRTKCSAKARRSAAYKHGYAAGLLAAYCQHALGAHPEIPQNRDTIIKTLKTE